MTETPRQTLRIIDANLNRIGEGLRVLEDIARLLLNDTGLTRQLKDLRHDLVRGYWALQQQLIQSRDSTGDIGRDIEAPGQSQQKQLPETVGANSRRVQESLRVIEELAKLPDLNLSTAKFRKARFAVYTIEKSLVSRLLRQDKTGKLPGLYVIIDIPMLKGRSHVTATRQAIRGGAATIQLRDKMHSKKELLSIARELKAVCAGHDVLFIVNDDLDIALAADADGLHLGPDDLPIKEARRLLPIDKILGCSAATPAEAKAAQAAGADYIAVGAIFPTSSKEIEVVGLDRLRRIKKAVTLPLVAIGGINKDNAAKVIASGADAVAVISAVLEARDIEAAAQQISERIKHE